MRKHKYLKYDAGQDLISCADHLAQKERELSDGGYGGLANVLRKCRLEIGDWFNKLGSHEFGLPGTDDLDLVIRGHLKKGDSQ